MSDRRPLRSPRRLAVVAALAAAAIALAQPAAAQPIAGSAPAAWVRVGQSPAGDEFFYDRDKLVLTATEVTYWRRVVFAVPQQMKTFSVRSALYREQLHCGEHTLRVIAQAFLTADGLVVEHTNFLTADPAPVVPDTIGSLFWRALCPMVHARRRDEEQLRGIEERVESRRRDLERARAEFEKLRAEVDDLEHALRRMRAERPPATDPAAAAQPPAPGPAPAAGAPAAPGAPATPVRR